MVGDNDQRNVVVMGVRGEGSPAHLDRATDQFPQHLVQRLSGTTHLHPSKSLVRVGELAAVIQTNGIGKLN